MRRGATPYLNNLLSTVKQAYHEGSRSIIAGYDLIVALFQNDLLVLFQKNLSVKYWIMPLVILGQYVIKVKRKIQSMILNNKM